MLILLYYAVQITSGQAKRVRSMVHHPLSQFISPVLGLVVGLFVDVFDLESNLQT